MPGGMDLLVRQRDRIQSLKQLHHGNPEYSAWLAQTERVIEEVFGRNSREFDQFHGIFFGPYFISTSTPDSIYQKDYEEDLEKARLLLNTFIEDMPAEVPYDAKKEVCPKCGSAERDFIEIRNTETKGFWGDVALLGGKKESVKSEAFYKCQACGTVYSEETTKV